jgi:RNA polymerase sigma-70 factor (ECF subfamily)
MRVLRLFRATIVYVLGKMSIGEEDMRATVEHAWMTFHTPLLQFVRRRVADDTSAEDILQDVFLKVHTHLDTLSDTAKLQSWLYQLTRNAIIDYYRRTRSTVPVSENLPAFVPEDENDVVARLAPAVKAMVAALPAIYREALYLTEYDGLTQKELAATLGISISGAKSRVQRARRLLRQMLLDCCRFELDRRGGIIGYQPRGACCTTSECSPDCRCP